MPSTSSPSWTFDQPSGSLGRRRSSTLPALRTIIAQPAAQLHPSSFAPFPGFLSSALPSLAIEPKPSPRRPQTAAPPFPLPLTPLSPPSPSDRYLFARNATSLPPLPVPADTPSPDAQPPPTGPNGDAEIWALHETTLYRPQDWPLSVFTSEPWRAESPGGAEHQGGLGADIPRSRIRLDAGQLAYLEYMWGSTHRPTSDERRIAASHTTLTPRQVQVWFQNRRAKEKRLDRVGHSYSLNAGYSARSYDAPLELPRSSPLREVSPSSWIPSPFTSPRSHEAAAHPSSRSSEYSEPSYSGPHRPPRPRPYARIPHPQPLTQHQPHSSASLPVRLQPIRTAGDPIPAVQYKWWLKA